MAKSAQKKNWFAIWVSVAVVVVLVAVGAIVIAVNNQASAPGADPEGSIINTETGAITLSEGSDTLATYVDFICPACAQFESIYGPTVKELATSGTIQLDVHPISILDRASQGTEYSTRAASAMYCVASSDPDAAYPFFEAMYVQQPAEGTAGLTDDQIAEIATAAGATSASECIADGRYMDYVSRMTPNTPVAEGAGGISTPTVVLNDEILALTGDPQADLASLLTPAE